MRKQMIEDAIRDRLINGFKNWNGGYDGTAFPEFYYGIGGFR